MSFLAKVAIKGLCYKTLRICKLWQMYRFSNKLVLYIADHKHTYPDKHTNLLTLQILNGFIVQAPKHFGKGDWNYIIKLFTAKFTLFCNMLECLMLVDMFNIE
jgi:hypothetical protein